MAQLKPSESLVDSFDMGRFVRRGPANEAPWIEIRGPLRRGDEETLALLASEPEGFAHVNLDLSQFDRIDDEDCDVMAALVKRLKEQGRRPVLLRPAAEDVVAKLQEVGLLDDQT